MEGLLNNEELLANKQALKALSDELNTIVAEIEKIANSDAFKDIKSLRAAQEALSKYEEVLESSAKTEKLLEQTTKQLAKAREQLAKQSKGNEKQIKNEAGSFDDLNERYKQSRAETRKLAETVNGELNPAYEVLSEQTAELKAQRDALAASEREQAKLAGLEKDSLEALRITVNTLVKDFGKLSRAERENEEVGGELIKTIKELNEELEETSGRGVAAAKKLVQAYEGLDEVAEETKESVGVLTDEYLEQIQVLNQLEAELADSTEFLGKYSKESRELRRRIREVNSTLRQNESALRRNIRQLKEYAKASRSLRIAINASKVAAGAFLAVFAAVGGVFSQGRDGAGEFAAALDTIKTNIASLISEFKELVQTAKDVAEWLGIVGDETEEGIDKLEEDEKARVLATAQIERQQKAIASLDIAINQQQRSLTELIDKNAKLSQQANDTRTSIAAQQRASTELIKNEVAIAEEQQKLARLRLALTSQEIGLEINRGAVALENSGIIIETTKGIIDADGNLLASALSNTEGLAKTIQERLNNRIVAGQVSAQADQQFTEAFVANEQAKTDAAVKQAEVQKRNREIISNRIELELDLTEAQIDQFVDLNDKQINNDRLSLAERQKLQAASTKALQDFVDDSIKRLESVAGKTIDFNKIRTESDVTRIRQELLNANLSEQLTTRLINLINIRRTTVLGLTDSQKTLNEAQREFNDLTAENAQQLNSSIIPLRDLLRRVRAEIEEINKDTELSEIERQKKIQEILKKSQDEQAQILKDAEIERLQISIEASKKERDQLAQDSLERAKIQLKINQDELKLLRLQLQIKQDLNKKSEEKVTDDLKKEQAKREEIIQASAAVFTAISDKIAEDRIASIDRQLTSLQGQEQALQILAARGDATAAESLARQQRAQAQLEAERERQAAAQQRRNLIIATLRSYASELNATGNPTQALTNTFRNTTLLTAFIKSLPAFYTGTEHVGNSLGSPHLNTSRDGYLVRVDGEERIFTGQDNGILSPYSNKEVVSIVQAHRNKNNVTGGFISPVVNMSPLVDGLDRVEKAVSSIPKVYEGFDNLEGLINTLIKRQGRTENNKRKPRLN